jgi:competence protein ComEA
MLKKLLVALAISLASAGWTYADVDVNKATQAELDGIKGIGPAKSKAILEERTKNGNFKDWADLEKRVKGIGDKSAEKLSASGLTVEGQAKPGAAVKAAADKKVKVAEKTADKAADKVTAAPASAAAATDTAAKSVKDKIKAKEMK